MVARLLAVDGPGEVAADLGPVPRVVAQDQQGDPRVTLQVLVALALGLGVDEEVLPVGVHPRVLRLRLAVGHEGDDAGQVLALGQTDDGAVERHGLLLVKVDVTLLRRWIGGAA